MLRGIFEDTQACPQPKAQPLEQMMQISHVHPQCELFI